MGRRQRRAAETRLRLFRCALELIAARGFSNVTVEDITQAADVGKGTFFNYFASKDHVLEVLAEIQLGKVRQAVHQAQSGNGAVGPVLRRFFASVAEEPGRSPELARAVISSFLASDVVRRSMEKNMAAGREAIAQVVALGQERGEIDPRLKTEQVALQLQQAFFGTLLLWSLRGTPKLQSAMEASWEHLWRAIAAPRPKVRS